MGYAPVSVSEFGGLDLRADPQNASALDVLNVDFQPGRIKTRPGYISFYDTAAVKTHALGAFSRYGQADQMWIGYTAGLRILTQAGVSLAVAAVSGPATGAAQFNTPTATYLYVSSAATPLQRWDGAAFATPAGTLPVGSWLTVTSWDNRLVAAGGNTALLGSKVNFSDAGNGDVWGANNYLYMSPGDGDPITGLATYRDMVFVGKPTKLFVFYSTSTDSSGNPVFNYRTIDAANGPALANGGSGAIPYGKTMCPTRYGVCFLSKTGVYISTGGEPQRISVPLDPFFNGEAMAFTPSLATFTGNLDNASIGYANDRLYVTPDNTVAVTFVYDFLLKAWSVYDWKATALAVFTFSNRPEVAVAINGSTQAVHRHSAAYTDDAGVAITTRYRSGFADFGPADEKVVREWLIDGTGSVGMAVAVNMGELDTASTVTLGTSPAIAQGRHRRAYRGRQFSTQLSSVAGAFTVQRVSANLRDDRGAGAESA